MNNSVIEHFGMTVSNIENTIEWYKQNFGFEEEKRFDKPGLELKGAVIKLGNTSIELLQPYKPARKQDFFIGKEVLPKDVLNNTGLAHFALSVKDINVLHKRLKEDNTRILTEIAESKYFFCTDPDGILLEIRQAKT